MNLTTAIIFWSIPITAAFMVTAMVISILIENGIRGKWLITGTFFSLLLPVGVVWTGLYSQDQDLVALRNQFNGRAKVYFVISLGAKAISDFPLLVNVFAFALSVVIKRHGTKGKINIQEPAFVAQKEWIEHDVVGV